MQGTGIVRKVDELGRIVIPIELRRRLNVETSDGIEILTDEDMIILRKYKPEMICMVTGEVSHENMNFADGNIVLSKEGAEQLIKELQSKGSVD